MKLIEIVCIYKYKFVIHNELYKITFIELNNV